MFGLLIISFVVSWCQLVETGQGAGRTEASKKGRMEGHGRDGHVRYRRRLSLGSRTEPLSAAFRPRSAHLFVDGLGRGTGSTFRLVWSLIAGCASPAWVPAELLAVHSHCWTSTSRELCWGPIVGPLVGGSHLVRMTPVGKYFAGRRALERRRHQHSVWA